MGSSVRNQGIGVNVSDPSVPGYPPNHCGGIGPALSCAAHEAAQPPGDVAVNEGGRRMSRCLHLLWHLLRYGRWTTCAHTASIEIYDGRAALGHGVRYVCNF